MKAYNNDITLKEKMIEQMKLHMEQDQLIKGTYDEGNKVFRGCAVGCALNSLNIIQGKKLSTSSHERYESELGIPGWLARLEDTLFEKLPKEEAREFPLKFLEAINVGSDLTKVKWQFSIYLLKENIDRVVGLEIEESLKQKVLSALRQVLAVNENAAQTGNWDMPAAESAAESAARSAKNKIDI